MEIKFTCTDCKVKKDVGSFEGKGKDQLYCCSKDGKVFARIEDFNIALVNLLLRARTDMYIYISEAYRDKLIPEGKKPSEYVASVRAYEYELRTRHKDKYLYDVVGLGYDLEIADCKIRSI